jgi:hypothetical protein
MPKPTNVGMLDSKAPSLRLPHACHLFYFTTSAINLSPMESIQGKVDQLGVMENTWCSLSTDSSPQPSNFDLLPETSKWVCRLEKAYADGEMCLKVSTAGTIHFFPSFYTSIFMLLDLQQLSSLAEAIRLPPNSPEIPRYMKNINFLAQLRLQIVTEKRVPENLEDSPFLKRWILRLIHGVPNLTPNEGDLKRAAEIYTKFENGCSWKKGIG